MFRAGLWRQELNEAETGGVLLVLLRGSFSLLLFTTQEHLPSGGTATVGWALPYQSLINKIPPQAYRPI